jgi:hypothetical protein
VQKVAYSGEERVEKTAVKMASMMAFQMVVL